MAAGDDLSVEDRNLETATSVNGVPIRLTSERWSHIMEEHDDLDGYQNDCLEGKIGRAHV